MLKALRFLDAFSAKLGHAVAWLSLFMVLLQFAVVVLRYASMGSIALQESVVYLHATLFMLAAGYTLQSNAHVRVDIFYQNFSARGKAWVNLLGSIFLLTPVAILIAAMSFGYVSASWSSWEGSREAGGIPAIWALKTLLLLLPFCLLLQALAEILRSLLTLKGQTDVAPLALQQQKQPLPHKGLS